ncbi:hypothetical protein FEM08_02410 [Flavobacterium gilvum]|nr:hypothetical protein FEM08_02410 [Flavobacterium gilvum]
MKACLDIKRNEVLNDAARFYLLIFSKAYIANCSDLRSDFYFVLRAYYH